MKTAISIPDKIFRSADELAKQLGVTRSKLYSTALTEFLSKYQGSKVTEQLNAIYEAEDSSLPDSLLDLQVRSLDKDVW